MECLAYRAAALAGEGHFPGRSSTTLGKYLPRILFELAPLQSRIYLTLNSALTTRSADRADVERLDTIWYILDLESVKEKIFATVKH